MLGCIHNFIKRVNLFCAKFNFYMSSIRYVLCMYHCMSFYGVNAGTMIAPIFSCFKLPGEGVFTASDYKKFRGFSGHMSRTEHAHTNDHSLKFAVNLMLLATLSYRQ